MLAVPAAAWTVKPLPIAQSARSFSRDTETERTRSLVIAGGTPRCSFAAANTEATPDKMVPAGTGYFHRQGRPHDIHASTHASAHTSAVEPTLHKRGGLERI